MFHLNAKCSARQNRAFVDGSYLVLSAVAIVLSAVASIVCVGDLHHRVLEARPVLERAVQSRRGLRDGRRRHERAQKDGES
jgi:hypothetical protein